MNKSKNKRYTSVLAMVHDLADDPAFAAKLDEQLAARQVAKTLFAKRSAQGLSQQDMAEKLNCSQSRVSKMEKGNDQDLRLGDLAAYAEALGFQVEIGLAEKGLTLADEVKYHARRLEALLDQIAQAADVQVRERMEEAATRAGIRIVLKEVDCLRSSRNKAVVNGKN